MRTYSRNVRRAWDGDDYHAPKRQRLDDYKQNALQPQSMLNHNNENIPQYEIEDNLERAIRETSVAALSSSPSRKNSTVFSFNEAQEEHESSTLTPPSSPPTTLEITPPVIKQRKPTFSALEKKRQKEKDQLKNGRKIDEPYPVRIREDSEPLSEIMNSSSRVVNSATIPPQPLPPQTNNFQPVRPPSTQPKALTQTVLDFGQANTPITCTQCQMSYTPSVSEDATLHSMFHNRHNQGIELGKPFMKSAMRWCYEVAHIPGSVVVVDRKISVPARRTVQKVLEVVNKELGSVEIPESELWGQKILEGEGDESKKVDRYKVFLHVIEGRCVAVCLAERISKGYMVTSFSDALHPDDVTNKEKEDSALLTPTSSNALSNSLSSSADLVLASEQSPTIVGVSRIWTSKTFRRKGIANNLLDCVMNQFIYGMEIDREKVAFSQPTDMGAALAKGWFGQAEGWTVYRED